MRKAIKGILIICSLLLLSSCQFTEELHITENGKGKITLDFDGAEMMAMMGNMGQATNSEYKEKTIDTVMNFKDFLEEHKDSIQQLSEQEQKQLKRLEDFQMHTLVNYETNEMKMSMFSDFDNVSELGDVLNDFQTASTLGGQGANMAPPGSDKLSGSQGKQPTKVEYEYTSKKFKRVTEILDKELLKKSVDSLDQMKMFLASSNYTLKYHFPKKIKKVSSEKAMFSQDGRTMTLQAGFLEYMENPKILDVEVEFE